MGTNRNERIRRGDAFDREFKKTETMIGCSFFIALLGALVVIAGMIVAIVLAWKHWG